MATAADTLMFQGTGVCIYSAQEVVANVTFDAVNSKLTRAAGDWQTNFSVDQFITVEDAVTNKKRCFQIKALTTLDLTVDVAPAAEGPVQVTVRAFDICGLIQDYGGPSTTNPEVDVSHSLSPAREKKPGLQDNGNFDFSSNRVRGDEGYIALRTLQAARLNADFLVAEGDRLGFTRFNASVVQLAPKGSLDSPISFDCSLSVSGALIESELFT